MLSQEITQLNLEHEAQYDLIIIIIIIIIIISSGVGLTAADPALAPQ